MRTAILLSVVIGCVSGMSGCVVNPTDGHLLAGPYEVVSFAGFASEPRDSVVIEVLNQRTGQYESLAATVAGHTPLTVGKRTLYYWHVSSAIAWENRPQSLCRWDESCQIQPGDVVAKLRARAVRPGGGGTTLFTHKAGGPYCVHDALVSGEVDDLFVAYWQCRPDDVLTFHVRVLT